MAIWEPSSIDRAMTPQGLHRVDHVDDPPFVVHNCDPVEVVLETVDDGAARGHIHLKPLLGRQWKGRRARQEAHEDPGNV